MKHAGQIVLFRFPHTDLTKGKLRPVLMLKALPGEFDDWLVCMISSQVHHLVPEFDEIIQKTDADFAKSGLNSVSVVRIGRLAVAEEGILLGAIGEISTERLRRVKRRLATWLGNA